MVVVDKKPVPIYSVTCHECKSKIEYKKSEVSLGYITCPVCKVSLMAMALSPVRFEECDIYAGA